MKHVEHIMLVEDDQRIRAAIVRSLAERGHAVQAAATAMDGLHQIVDWNPDIVLLDLGLPDMSGAEVAEVLRRAEGFETTVFVAVSGHGPDRIPPVFHGHFIKPVDHDALGGFLARLASEGRRPRAGGTGPPS